VESEGAELLLHAPITGFEEDETLRVDLGGPAAHLGGKAAAIGEVVELAVEDLAAGGALLVAKMLHGGEEKREPPLS
jgi:hypothetical protein